MSLKVSFVSAADAENQKLLFSAKKSFDLNQAKDKNPDGHESIFGNKSQKNGSTVAQMAYWVDAE